MGSLDTFGICGSPRKSQWTHSTAPVWWDLAEPFHTDETSQRSKQEVINNYFRVIRLINKEQCLCSTPFLCGIQWHTSILYHMNTSSPFIFMATTVTLTASTQRRVSPRSLLDSKSGLGFTSFISRTWYQHQPPGTQWTVLAVAP